MLIKSFYKLFLFTKLKTKKNATKNAVSLMCSVIDGANKRQLGI